MPGHADKGTPISNVDHLQGSCVASEAITRQGSTSGHSDIDTPCPHVSGKTTACAAAALAPPRVGGELPHMLIGGSDSQSGHFPVDSESECGIDWISCSFPIELFGQVVDYMQKIYNLDPEYHDHGRYFYDARVKFDPHGCQIYYDSTKERADRLHNGRFAMEISGTGLQQFTADGLYRLVYDLIMTYRGQFSRIDLCWDDYKRRITPLEIAEFANEGLFTGFRSQIHLCKRKRNGEVLSDTINFGSRGSGTGKFLRIYDKYLESGGKVDCIRYEVQFSKNRSKAIGIKLATCGTLEEFAMHISGLIGGSIDFIERKDKNLDRANRLDWWEAIVNIMGSCVLRNPKRVETVEKSVEFIERLSATLAMVKHAKGDREFIDFIQEVTAMEESELPDRHKRLLEHYRIVEEVPF